MRADATAARCETCTKVRRLVEELATATADARVAASIGIWLDKFKPGTAIRYHPAHDRVALVGTNGTNLSLGQVFAAITRWSELMEGQTEPNPMSNAEAIRTLNESGGSIDRTMRTQNA